MRRILSLVLLVGCATTPRSESEPPRSSVDVLLRRADELKLTEGQRAALQDLEDKRHNKAERLRIDLQQQYLDTTSGDNRNLRSNRGSNEGVRQLDAKVIAYRKKLRRFDDEALERAKLLLDDDQRALALSFAERWRLERHATQEEDGE